LDRPGVADNKIPFMKFSQRLYFAVLGTRNSVQDHPSTRKNRKKPSG
jgi:hypothetical protein